MKTLRLKLMSMLAMLFLMFGVLTVGIFAVNQQTVTLSGNISFRVEDRSLYVKQVRIKQDNGSEPQIVGSFKPGYINGEFNMNIGEYSGENANKIGSFALYFDIINTTDIQWAISSVTLAPEIENSVSVSYSGVVYETTITEVDENGDKVFAPEETDINGTLMLIVSAPNSDSIDLSDITIIIDEYISNPAVQVTNVQINDSTPNATDIYNGVKGFIKPLDLSNISFETGTTKIIISMTSLKPTYIKNNVSWYNTSGVTITSTSLYLPKNTTGDITGGESRDLKITVTNNNSAPTTIEGLEVAFEEKEDLLQATAEGEVSEYTGEGYWYVEMGTYSTTTDNEEGKRVSKYLRWRYFAEETTEYNSDTNTAPAASRYNFNASERPTGNGYFILETYVDYFYTDDVDGGLRVSFNNDYSGNYHQEHGWTNVYGSDYSTSTIRQYIIGNTVQKTYSGNVGTTVIPSGDASNMFNDLHIDPENDIVYSQIISRTLGDLYSNMRNTTTVGATVFPDLSGADEGYQYQMTDSDKFWLLSYYEANRLLSSAGREWGASYSLRTPDGTVYHYTVSTYGKINFGIRVIGGTARAAFKLAV